MNDRVLKFTIFLSITVTLVAFWDHEIMSYLKDLVVLIHEMGHAIAALVTGGQVKHIAIHANESGETVAIPSKMRGAFFFVVSAGYIGSAFFGGLLLNIGFRGRHVKPTLVFVGAILFLVTVNYSKLGNLAYATGLLWGLVLIGIGLFSRAAASIGLVFLGVSISLYSMYDLLDFTKGVHQTDAGILAYWILGYKQTNPVPGSVTLLGYLIAVMWSFLSLGIIFISVHKAIKVKQEEAPVVYEEPSFPGEVTPEVIEWFVSRGLDLNGRPLQPELGNEKEHYNG